MNTSKLVISEILHRRWSFVIGVFAVMVSVACLLGSLALLESFDRYCFLDTIEVGDALPKSIGLCI